MKMRRILTLLVLSIIMLIGCSDSNKSDNDRPTIHQEWNIYQHDVDHKTNSYGNCESSLDITPTGENDTYELSLKVVSDSFNIDMKNMDVKYVFPKKERLVVVMEGSSYQCYIGDNKWGSVNLLISRDPNTVACTVDFDNMNQSIILVNGCEIEE